MKNKHLNYFLIFFLLQGLIFSNHLGYLRTIDVSFCMDECSQFYLESEDGQFITNVTTPIHYMTGYDDVLEFHLNRFISVVGDEEVWCVECGALMVESIDISSDCEMPVSCFEDPCEVAPECQLNTPVNCISNYCGGCYADFYNLEGNLVDCYNQEIDECYDLGELDFGMCDMYMGVAIVNESCQYVSGCGWIIDGVDYNDAFFQNMEDCEESCFNLYFCEDIEYDYDQLFYSEITSCEYNNDCISIWGDCDVGLGGCHYSVNPDLYNENLANDLVTLWLDNDCAGGVCDCLSLPNSVCTDGNCELAYCYDENPEGCFSSGCPEGYQCINDPNNCTPSSCFCDESNFYGNWSCTEDCGGGTCVPFLNGDVNYDGILNVADIIIIVNMILFISEPDMIADVNQDSNIDIIDIVLIVDYILN